MAKRQQMTGCQKQFTVGLLIVSSILVAVALSIGYVRSEGRCTIVGTSTIGLVGKIDVELYMGNDEVVESVFQQVHATSDETRSFIEQYTPGQTHSCGYNRWFPEEVVFGAGSIPTRHYFWITLAAAILVGGFALANMLNIVNTRETPPGLHQPIRLRVDGGQPGPQLWFLWPMIAVLGGAMVCLFMAVRLRWLFFDAPFWVSLIFLVLCGIGWVVLLYWALRQLFLLRMGTEAIVEISHQPVRSNQTAQLYVSLNPGKLTVQALQIKLVCEETIRKKVRGSRNNPDSYKNESHILYESTIHEEPDFQQLNFLVWEKALELVIPESARSSVEEHYPKIRWWIAMKVSVPNAPDFTFDFPIQVKQ